MSTSEIKTRVPGERAEANGRDLIDEQLLRYSRQIMLPQIDITGQQRLLASSALIIGVGGLGSPVALYLAACGVASRRGAEPLIREGRVEVNDRKVVDLATFVEPGTDRVCLDGAEVVLPRRHTTWLLHKPPGIVSTARDPGIGQRLLH